MNKVALLCLLLGDFTPALSSSPGHAPTQEESCLAEGKVAAVAPTSAMICCAESAPSPGTSASRSTASRPLSRQLPLRPSIHWMQSISPLVEQNAAYVDLHRGLHPVRPAINLLRLLLLGLLIPVVTDSS